MGKEARQPSRAIARKPVATNRLLFDGRQQIRFDVGETVSREEVFNDDAAVALEYGDDVCCRGRDAGKHD